MDADTTTSVPSRKRLHQSTAEARAVHNKLERDRRKQMTQTIKEFVKILPYDTTGKKDKTSILEAVVNFFEVIYENMVGIEELERDFINSETTQAHSQSTMETDTCFSQSANRNIDTEELEPVDIQQFELFVAMQGDQPKLPPSLITNSHALLLEKVDNGQTSAAGILTRTHQDIFGWSADSPTEP